MGLDNTDDEAGGKITCMLCKTVIKSGGEPTKQFVGILFTSFALEPNLWRKQHDPIEPPFALAS